MDAKLNIPDISTLLAKRCDIPMAKAEYFSRMFFDVIIEGLEKDGLVKINGLGTFKIIDVASRGSVNVNTGEKIEIKGHRKLTFLPSDALKDKVNEAFAMFEPVEVNDDFLDDEPLSVTETAEEEGNVNEIDENKPEMQQDNSVSEPDNEEIVQTALPTQPEQSEQSPKNTDKTESDITDVKHTKKHSAIIYVSILLLFVIIAGAYLLFNDKSDKESYTAVVPAVAVQKENVDTVLQQKNETVEEDSEEKPFVLLEELKQTSLSAITLNDTLLYKSTGNIAVHKVGADETLTKIALKYYNDKKLWPYLVKYNNMGNHNRLEIGMELLIPKLVPRK